MTFLQNFFTQNGYPTGLFTKTLHDYLETKVFRPQHAVTTVAKDVYYLSMPYLGFKQVKFNKELKSIINKYYPSLQVNTIPINPLSLGSLFKFKDSLPIDFRSGVVYLFTCPKCDLGMYLGCTIRQLRARVLAHRGISHRTLEPLGRKENSNIRNHTTRCKCDFSIKNFKIISFHKDQASLLIAESINLKIRECNLNSDSASVPLLIT